MAYIGSSIAPIASRVTSVNVSSSLTPPGGGSPVKPPAGTLVLAMMQGGTNVATLTPPSGWTAIPGCPQQVTGNVGTQGAWYRVFDGSEGASFTFQSNQSDFQTVALLGFSGRNTSSPFTATADTPQEFGASPFVLVCNPVTAAAGDDVVILGGNRFFNGTNAVSYAPPTGFGNANCVYANVQYSPVAFWSIQQNVVPGSYGGAGGTITVPVDTNNQGSSAYVVALAQNTTAATYVSLAGAAFFGFEGAVEIVQATSYPALGSFTFTGQNASAAIGFSGGTGTLVGNPDFTVTLPYRWFTVVLE